MIVFTKKDLMFYSFMFVILVISIVMPITVDGFHDTVIDATANLEQVTIVVDAGHGEPDGGAVSANGVKESDLNLMIAKKLRDKLKEENFNVVMTRENENNVADSTMQNSSIREIKTADLNNRVKIANGSDALLLVSIHMNKFQDSKYRGWQTFYSQNSEKGKLLAESIQESIKESVEIENNRTALKIDGIKIIDKSTIPAVIVECGFLSNPEECALLQNDEYQEKLAEGIKSGIEKYLSKMKAST
ncbi:MAG: N-acetylmuramoyl-L-alanine amidase [Clostridia bacterium]|nr:N-acetylmuramoyl-L-alanine amidase [Clostridia bacterium]